MAKTPRTWTGARTPSGLKRVRQANRRHEVLGPQRTAAKTYVAKALSTASAGDAEATSAALLDALSALDRAAKSGAIHANAAARRKSRLTRKVNDAVGGVAIGGGGSKVVKQTGKAAAAKAARARIAAGRSTKAKGAQTAAGKARAALSKTARAEAAAARDAEASAVATTTAAKPARPAAKTSTTKASTAKSTSKSTAAKSTATKASASKSPATKATASKSTAKAPAKRTTKS